MNPLSNTQNTLLRLPRHVLVKIARKLNEKDLVALATTCRLGARIVRHSTWSTGLRIRNLTMKIAAPGDCE